MEVRQYDPAIARFTGIDPVTHHSMSTYTAFDNNPVYFSDPAGANAYHEGKGQDEARDDSHGRAFMSQGRYISVTDRGGLSTENSLKKENASSSGDNGGKKDKKKKVTMMTGDLEMEGVDADEEAVNKSSSNNTGDLASGIGSYFGWMGSFSGIASYVSRPLGNADPFTYVKIFDAVSNTGKSYYMHNPNRQYDFATAKYKENIQGLSKVGNILAFASMGVSLVQYKYDSNYGYSFGKSKYARETELGADLIMTRVGMSPSPYAIGASLFYFYAMKPAAMSTQKVIDSRFGGSRAAWRANMGFNPTGSGYCFVAGTKITMSDGETKNIEDIQVGDLIKTFNIKKKNIEFNKVLKVDSPTHNNLIKISFDNLAYNINTKDHPYYVKNKGWASFDPDLTFKNYNFKVAKLELGDFCYLLSNQELVEVKVSSIIEVSGLFTTYNLSEVEKNNNFFANGILVHNKYNNR